jgi:hypothetical protein
MKKQAVVADPTLKSFTFAVLAIDTADPVPYYKVDADVRWNTLNKPYISACVIRLGNRIVETSEVILARVNNYCLWLYKQQA